MPDGPTLVVTSVDDWFARRLKGLRCDPETIAYVSGVFRHQAWGRSDIDMSHQSVVLAYDKAVNTGDFSGFQRLGDWVLWAEAMVPASITSHDIVRTLGQRSYAACHRILQGKCAVYQRLADELPDIVSQVRTQLVKVYRTMG